MKGNYQVNSDFVGSEEFDYLMEKYGPIATHVITVLESIIWREDTCTYRLDKVYLLAAKCRCDVKKLQDILEDLILINLFGTDKEIFWSNQLNQNVKNISDASDRAKKAVAAREEKKRHERAIIDRLTQVNGNISSDHHAISKDNPTLSTGGVGVGEGVRFKDLKNCLDEISRNDVILKYRAQGLDESDIDPGLDELERHYAAHPKKFQPPQCVPRDLKSQFIIKLLLETKTNRIRAERARDGPESFADRASRQMEESIKKWRETA